MSKKWSIVQDWYKWTGSIRYDQRQSQILQRDSTKEFSQDVIEHGKPWKMAKRLINTLSFSLVPTFPTRRTVFWMSPSPTYSKLMIRPVCLSTTKIGKHTGVSTENIWQKVFLNYGESLFFVVFFYIYWIVNFLIDSFIVRSCQLKRNMFAEVHYPISIYLLKCNYINLVKPWWRKQLLPLLSLFSNKYKKITWMR